MASATCEVNVAGGGYASAASGVDCTPNGSVVIRPVSSAGMLTWTCQCIATDETTTPATINGLLVVDGGAKTATMTFPNTRGLALRMRSTATDFDGSVSTSDFVLYSRSARGKRVIAFEESLESSAFGTLAQSNPDLRGLGQIAVDMANNARSLTLLEVRHEVIKVTSTPNFSAGRTLTFPAPLVDSDAYMRVVRNTQGGAFAVTCSTGAGTTVAVAQNRAALLLFDTSGVVRITADSTP